ncbi:NAD-dependent epimerase/dehydratase family protein [Umezawaea sp. Da 62-37]|uniref:NAD-dependent epimerase/dehydratase family protein n=1 Tax=Umezawaea sp. Da 62-37 TaxID=3075927 RepID=UPI0028F720AF|nr:NAD-dependent epimerase/dehydratase family protein [Umezawaea sp. Da 62-37]WNV87672.1 GDP-mannose 4,6-dehydratase [Umezawaea sp. Da 62-37]
MRTLVTGGAGFIGSHLTEHLLRAGDEVVVLDDLSTGREANLDAMSDHPGLRLVVGSVCDREIVDRCVRGVDRVFHAAASVGVLKILEKPLQSLRTNVHGTEIVLQAALEHGVPILITSTSEVYGKNSRIGLREDDDRVLGSPLKSRWSYAEAKAVAESMTHGYTTEHGLTAVIVRLFNTVGPRQAGQYGMVVPRFVEQALAGRPLTVYGDGHQIRCFCHVLDVVPAMVALLEDERAHGDVFNLGGTEQVSIGGLAERVIAVTGSTSDIVHLSYEQAYGEGFEDMRRRVPDSTKALERVGFRPRRDLDDVIAAVAAHSKQRREVEHA